MIGKIIRKYRKKKECTVVKMSKMLGQTQNAYVYVEANGIAGVDKMVRIFNLLEYEVEIILTDKNGNKYKEKLGV